MNNDFVAEILRATGSLQSGDPAGVSAIIASALAAAGLAIPGAGIQGSPNAGFQLPEMPRRPGPTHIEGRIAGRPEHPGAETDRPNELRSDRLRKSLGEVVKTLAAGRKGLGLEGNLPGLGVPAPSPELPLPEGAEFRDLHYSCAAGARRYRLYVPASAGEGLQGLVVMLHGCTQSPEDFAAGTGMNHLG
jgi:Esterase PHB depolymerase